MRSSERGDPGALMVPLLRFPAEEDARLAGAAKKKRRHQGGAEDASAPATGEGGVTGLTL